MGEHPPNLHPTYELVTRLENLCRDAETISNRLRQEMTFPAIPTQDGGSIHTEDISPYSPQYADEMIREFEKMTRAFANGFQAHTQNLRRQLGYVRHQ